MRTTADDEFAMLPIELPTDTTGNRADFWEKSMPILKPDGSGIVRGGMFEHQRTWWDLPNFVKVLVGGYGCGKTMIFCKRLISLALLNAPCPVAAVSPTFPQARETTIATFKELLNGKRQILGRAFFWSYNNTSHQFTIKYCGRTARILVYSGENPDALKGPNLAAAGIDEPFIQDIGVYKQILARIRHPDAVHKELCITGTPEQLNWGYDLCLGKDKEMQDVGFVQASTRQNKALDPNYVKQLEASYSTAEAEAYIDGSFKNLASGQVYYAFDQRNVLSQKKIPPDAEWGVGMDFNVDPMAFVVFWHTENAMHVVQEFEMPNADTEQACQELREQWYSDKLREVFPDASGQQRRTSASGGKTDFTYLKLAGFDIRCKGNNPLIKDRYNAVNGLLKARNGKVRLTIEPSCVKLTKYLAQYSHETKNKQKEMSHLLDALGYPIAYLFPVDRETLSVRRLGGT